MEANKTQIMNFVLQGLTDRPELQVPLFLVFLVIYLITMLFKPSCTDPGVNMLLVFVFSVFMQSFTFMTIIVSYSYVLLAILKKKAEKGKRKAISTCSAHLLSVSLFYGTLFFMYVRPGSGPAEVSASQIFHGYVTRTRLVAEQKRKSYNGFGAQNVGLEKQ
ncbi:hypothetical protein H8959_020551 [Pygathrix nigripes]